MTGLHLPHAIVVRLHAVTLTPEKRVQFVFEQSVGFSIQNDDMDVTADEGQVNAACRASPY